MPSPLDSAVPESPWLVRFRPNPSPLLRVFCFPYAGGTASAFRTWAYSMPAQVEFIIVQLPGRESRIREPLITDLPTLADGIAGAAAPYTGNTRVPSVFFGHSLGGLVAFETARSLRRMRSLAGLQKMIVAACAAPDMTDEGPVEQMSNRQFLDRVAKLGGIPDEILANRELLELVLPVLKADFSISGEYRSVPDAPLQASITAFGGLEDPKVSRNQLLGWERYTTGAFALRTFPGGHFFINPHRAAVIEALTKELV